MADFECICSVVKGERDIAWGEDCYCWYPKPNYNERIVRCRDCEYAKWKAKDCDGADIYRCRKFKFDVSPDGFCAWGERKAVER